MVEKYERVIDYLYPLAQTIPRKHGTFRELLIRQRRKLKHLLAHGDHDGWRRSQIAWMGHIRHGDGQNGLKHLGLALPC
jgi:hypothetical protein